MKYYLLIIRELPAEDFWTVEFSAYEKDIVQYEMDALDLHHKKKDMKIVSLSSASQSAIDKKMAFINKTESEAVETPDSLLIDFSDRFKSVSA